MYKTLLKPDAPFDFAKMIVRLKGTSHGLYRVEDETLVRTLRIDGTVCLVRMTSLGTTESPLIEVEAIGLKDESQLAEAGDRLRRIFSMDVDLHAFYEHLQQDPMLAPIGDEFRGLRFILEADPFESMTKTIIGQQLNLAFAAELNRKLIETTSKPFVYKGNEYLVFPTVEQVAELEPRQLRELKFSQRKAEYVIDFARSVVNGDVDFTQLQQQTDSQVMEQLIRLRGIGRWTVECFLMFGMGRTDLLPAADIGLRNGIKKWYGLDYQPKEEEVRSLGRAWSPWSSYATLYLWQSLK